MKKFLIISLAVVLAWGFGVMPASAQSVETKLTASDGAEWNQFGRSVSVSGNTIVVGAEYDNDNGVSSGSAYVFVREETSWIEQQKLTASDGAALDLFGNSVSVSGNTIVVGAHGDDDNGQDSGSAYVFVREGTSWTEQQKLTASDGAAADFFGYSVSVSGDTIVIGAHGDDDNGVSSGSAYVFVREETSWTEQQKLTASDGEALDFFGYSVSVSGDTIAVGAEYDDDNGQDSGSAYVFVGEETSWTEQQKLTASDGEAADFFGYSVSVSGDTIAVGAHSDDDNGQDSGSAYVFVGEETSWTEQQKLTASDGEAADFFGYSVSISGDTIAVGAKYDDDNGQDSGSAYVFVGEETSWTEQQKLTASDGAAADFFGYSVSISGDTIVIGAAYDDDNGQNSGSAYVYNAYQDPAVLIDNLDSYVDDLNPSDVIKNSLCAKLGVAMKAIRDLKKNNDVAAVNAMGAFVNQVEAQRGKKITEEDADALIAKAQAIIALLSSH